MIGFDPKQLAYAIAALEGFAPADRQGFLEMRSLFRAADKMHSGSLE